MEGSNMDGFEIHVTEQKSLPNEEWLKAKLTKITRKDGKYGPMLVFSFQTSDQKYNNQIVWATVGSEVSSNPNSKSYKWYSSLLGRELTSGEKVVLSPLIGKSFEIFLESRIGGQKVFQNVTRIRTVGEQEVKQEVKQEIKKVEQPVKKVEHKEVPIQPASVEEELEDISIDDLDLDSDIPL